MSKKQWNEAAEITMIAMLQETKGLRDKLEHQKEVLKKFVTTYAVSEDMMHSLANGFVVLFGADCGAAACVGRNMPWSLSFNTDSKAGVDAKAWYHRDVIAAIKGEAPKRSNKANAEKAKDAVTAFKQITKWNLSSTEKVKLAKMLLA